jgi:hypothetical protein
VPITGVPGFPPTLTSALIFQTLFAQNKVQCTVAAAGNAACITPADLTQFGINITHTGPVPPLSVVFSGQPDYQSPYSQQAEFGIEREITRGWAVSLSGIYVHTIGLPVAIDVNDLPTVPTSTITLSNGAQVKVHNFNTSTTNALTPGLAPCGGAAIINCFVNPLRLQSDQYSSKGSALYEGAILEVKKRFSTHFSLLANYTLSKAFDTTTDFNSDFGPADNTNLSGERALSNFDQRHKVVFAAIVDSGNRGGRLLSGFQVSPVIRFNSGHPFNLLAGSDVNGDRHSTNDRPVGAARNTGQGPDFTTFDMRITRRFKMGERANLQLLAEGFNLLNRTNYASVNNIAGIQHLQRPGSQGESNHIIVYPPGLHLGFPDAPASVRRSHWLLTLNLILTEAVHRLRRFVSSIAQVYVERPESGLSIWQRAPLARRAACRKRRWAAVGHGAPAVWREATG